MSRNPRAGSGLRASDSFAPSAGFRRRPTRSSGPADPTAVTPATREETMPAGLLAVVAGFFALAISAKLGYMLLYGDAVAHLGIARRILDTNTPGLANWGGVWLPLPHLLMLPFVGHMEWWQNGMAGAWPSLICYVVGVMGMYRLARRVVPMRWAMVATAFFGLNANLLYLSTTPLTEPLFLALLVWIVLLTLELVEAMREGLERVARNRFVLLGLLILAAVMTRYDGWVLGAAVWCVGAWQMWKRPALRRGLMPSFVAFTLLALAGPVAWLWFNHRYEGDWLDFMRGPNSAKEIDRKTSPPGARKYFGWHDPAWSLMLYARTAQVDAAWWETGWLVAAGALWGAWKAWRARLNGAVFLLWLPLPFYVYSIAYGSVPIFVPQIYPHSFYNSRYGVEMLPMFALFATYALWMGVRALARYGDGKGELLAMRVGPPVMLVVILVNTMLMLHATPLVLKEAMTNSRGRLAEDQPLAQILAGFRPGAKIVMDSGYHVGAFEMAGVPLRQVIGPGDYYGWRDAMAQPAASGPYLITTAGDELSQAIAAHPQGLTELEILCASGEKCLRVYQSDRFAGGGAR